MNVNSLKALEFDRIRALLLQQAGSPEGVARLEALQPSSDPGAVREALARTGEGVVLLRAIGRQPYHDLPDPADALAVARARGAHLEPRALADLASFIEGGVEIAWRVARAEGAPRLARLACDVRDTSEVAAAVRRALLPTGEVADDASPRLADVRRTLLRLKSQLTTVMEGYLRSRDAERLLQDRVITTRNDRYVLVLKAENKGQLPGIIHGSSGSGASLFVEPLPAVELNNDIVSLQDEERAEVIRILRELTARAGERAADIALMATVLGELDAVQAMALLAVEMDAQAPEIVDERAGVELVDSRHPLLMPGLAARLGITRTKEPVAVTIRVGGGEPVLVISGPNTGGKTVALKTVGLFALMAQCGLHVPAAAGSRLPVFRRVYADIGDEQSIAENLSTFSSHLAAIVEMTRDLARPALVLLDEVGAGTDPTEGGALGVAIVEHFRRQGATVIATTHHGLMKAYAQSTPGVACASFGYRPGSFEPTYRLNFGTPGRSLALEMAERLGLPPAVVADARARRDDKEEQAEALLARLEAEQAAARAREAARRGPAGRGRGGAGARARRRARDPGEEAQGRRGLRARAAAADRGGRGEGRRGHPSRRRARRGGTEGGHARAARAQRGGARDPRRPRRGAEGPRARDPRGAGRGRAPSCGRRARARAGAGRRHRRGAGARGRECRGRDLRQAARGAAGELVALQAASFAGDRPPDARVERAAQRRARAPRRRPAPSPSRRSPCPPS